MNAHQAQSFLLKLAGYRTSEELDAHYEDDEDRREMYEEDVAGIRSLMDATIEEARKITGT